MIPDTQELPKNVFMTGAAGFIGRSLASYYRQYGVEVGAIDFAEEPE